MCGIFAYLNYNTNLTLRQIADVLIGGLKRLEYRGYDSAGICIDTDGTPEVVKRKGPVNALAEAVAIRTEFDDEKSHSHIGIAHTRWATHGEPSDKNAHPITSDTANNDFVVVHNGIVTNYSTLKQVLQKRGFTFDTDTDTEAIAKLLKFLYDEVKRNNGSITFPELLKQVMDHLEGAYAIVVKSRHYPNEIIGCKIGSPMIVGVGERRCTSPTNVALMQAASAPVPSTEVFIASDASAIVEHTRRVIYLEDNDIVHVKDGKLEVLSTKSDEHPLQNMSDIRSLQTLEMDIENIMKGQYDHYMLKEIFEQPESLQTTMRGRMDFDAGEALLSGFKGEVGRAISTARRIMFIGMLRYGCWTYVQ